ncbi:T9SS type A sorting domain-containing protein [Candidatus Poribacteria bacterium]|nr:T9SS type A sorting domain-containing protein [Candidatus Poribacteria bacterium]
MFTRMRAKLALFMFLIFCSIIPMQAIAQDYDGDEPLGRLLVADGETGLLQLIELDNGEVIETFMMEGTANVYTTESGRIAGVVQYGANRVDFIDSGLYLEAHGDHFDKKKGRPSLLLFSLTGEMTNSQRPVHFVSHEGRVSIHFDGNFAEGVDSKNVIVREEDLFLPNPDTLIITSAQQHGYGIPVHGGKIVFSEPDPDREFGSLPFGFVVLDEQGNVVQTFADKEDFQASCLGIHGEAGVGEHLLFGCNEKREDGTGDGGIFVMTHDPVTGLFSAHKIAYPDGLRTSILRSHHAQPFAIGNYGSRPDPGYKALVRINPDSTEIDPNDIQQLSTDYRGFDFEKEHGNKLAVLTVDGLLQVFNPSDWTLLGSTQVVEDFSGAEGLRPALTVGSGFAYVSNPNAGEILEVDLDTVSVSRTFSVEGQPVNMAALGWVAPLGPVPARDADHSHEHVADGDDFSHVYYASLSEGLNMISSPLKPRTPMDARSLAEMVGATMVIKLDDVNQEYVGWTPDAPDNGFPIEGAKGYIVNLPRARQVAFVGAPWTNQPQVSAAPIARSIDTPANTWAFVVSGQLEGVQNLEGYLVTVRNLRTNAIMTNRVRNDYFAAATADLSRQSVVRVGDTLEVTVVDVTGEIASEKLSFVVTPEALANAVLPITLKGIGIPKQSLVLQNYPNPFNPETWIPYRLSESAPVTLTIYDMTGRLVRTLSLGIKPAGFYQGRARAAYWDGLNDVGERVSSGVYFYRLSTPSFYQMKRMIILK